MNTRFLICCGLLATAVMTPLAIKGEEFSVRIPMGASLELGTKTKHFVDFDVVEPILINEDGETQTFTYDLTNGTTYNYRTWKDGGLTNAGYFKMNSDASKRPELSFTEDDYNKNPKDYIHDVQYNKGYETGDIFLNINERGHLKMEVGESFMAHAMRSWELTDNVVNNYFIEPDFHFTVLGPDGESQTGVIEIENNSTGGTSAWWKIKALNKGTSIVLVTYDGIKVNYYSNATKKEFAGGEYWGAIWPENTGVFVVTVSEEESDAVPNMLINQAYNEGAKKLAGDFVDAEHDVFYYLDDQEGCYYTFSPEKTGEVTISRPAINDTGVTYTGFTSEGITPNQDGSYTILLTEGRNIVKLVDKEDRAVYQILTARPCQREIINLTRNGNDGIKPGDKVMIQYSGLRHPANKLAGIYNMSAYVTYNNIPNGSELIQTANQYQFGSTAKAQAITVTIPLDYDTNTNKTWRMSDGVIQVNGFGDPIGNHRNTDPLQGRSPNFNAVAHKTYFGSLPDIEIPLDVETGIQNIAEENGKYIIYNLQGIKVMETHELMTIKSLPAGIYIINGRKVVLR